MNSYNNKNHNNSINNTYNKTNSTKSGFDLIVISLAFFIFIKNLSLVTFELKKIPGNGYHPKL